MRFPPSYPEAIINNSALAGHNPLLRPTFERGWQQVIKHGDFFRWQQALNNLPPTTATSVSLNQSSITSHLALTESQQHQLYADLQSLSPWRKGPFCIAGIHIDCEWRSDLKWDRLTNSIAPLNGRTVLDIGCGSGYHCWRMRGAGARLVIGIDPTALFAMQFQAVQHFIADPQVQMWPLGIEEMPDNMGCFDTLFSMGLLYHRRSPLDHLKQLRTLLRPGGELVLETLVVEGDAQTCLVPEQRYAKMRNVWFIPSVAMLIIWLKRCGWHHVRLIHCASTTCEEQRSTEWMPFESLADFLDSTDHSHTTEGYPAPLRAILIAQH